MLRFFRINDPYRLIFIFLLMIIIRVIQGYFIDGTSYYELKWLLLGEWLNQGFIMYAETFDYTGPIAAFVYKYLYLLFGRSAFIHYGFSSLIIIFQAGVFNQLMLKNKAYDENSYLPAFLYMILMVSIPDFMTLSPQLMSLTFVLLSLRNVLRRIDNQVTDELFLNAGFYLGIAAMIYLPSMVFFLIFLFALIIFSTAVTRRILLYLFSFLLAFSLCTLYFYWRDDFSVFLDSYVVQNLLLSASSPLELLEIIVIGAFFIAIFFLSVIKTWSTARLTQFQQKIQQMMWLMLIGAVATFLLSNEKSLHELVFAIPVITYFWTHYFILIRRRIFKAIMPALLVFGILTYSILNYQLRMEPLMLSQRTPETGLMVLGSDLSYYQEVEMLTPCFNEHLSKRAFKGLNYYQSASEIYLLFERANPDKILDQIGVMPNVQSRIVPMEKKYRKVGEAEYQKISN